MMSSLFLRIKKFASVHWMMLGFLLLFLLMLARNPFSQRTVIANLEPFPDSFHYINPAFSFMHGHGFMIEREGRGIKPSVPPLYSLSFVPFFFIHPDVRMFYFTNVLLAIGSFLLFYSIVTNLFRNKAIQFFVLLLYVTSSLLIWFPTLAMAENLLLLLYVSAVWLLVARYTPKYAILAGFVSLSFYATKYASLPLSLIFPVLYAVKLATNQNLFQRDKFRQLFNFKVKKTIEQRTWIGFIGSFVVFASIDLLYEYFAKGNNVLGGLFGLFFAIVLPKPAVNGQGSGTGGFFGLQFVAQNLHSYIYWLLGNPIQILWEQIVIMPKILAIPSLLGLFLSIRDKRYRLIGVCLILMIISVLSFMSVFYAYDGRYLIIAVPSLFLGFGFFLSLLFSFFPQRRKLCMLLVYMCALVFFALNFKQLRFQIALNLKYTQTPWYYVSVVTFDEYLRDHQQDFHKTPVVISALPPYLIDAYAKQKFIVLPLNKGQEFRSYTHQAWGEYDFDHLDQVYEKFIADGHPVFLAKYGLGNEQFLHADFERLLQNFDAQKVKDGCFDLCTLYELHLKKQK